MNDIGRTDQLQIGALIFPGIDQIDFTGPFEIFSRLPGATYQVIAKNRKPVRDTRGLILTPEKTYSEISRLDLLHVPGGPGEEARMEDEETLSFIRDQAASADHVFSVCTGALIPPPFCAVNRKRRRSNLIYSIRQSLPLTVGRSIGLPRRWCKQFALLTNHWNS